MEKLQYQLPWDVSIYISICCHSISPTSTYSFDKYWTSNKYSLHRFSAFISHANECYLWSGGKWEIFIDPIGYKYIAKKKKKESDRRLCSIAWYTQRVHHFLNESRFHGIINIVHFSNEWRVLSVQCSSFICSDAFSSWCD